MPLRSSLPSVPHFLLRHLAKQLQTPTPVGHAESAVEGQVVGRNLVVRGGPGKEHGPKSKKNMSNFFRFGDLFGMIWLTPDNPQLMAIWQQ